MRSRSRFLGLCLFLASASCGQPPASKGVDEPPVSRERLGPDAERPSRHQLECRLDATSCRRLFKLSDTADLERELRVPELEIRVKARVVYSGARAESAWVVSLEDERSGRASSKGGFLRDNASVVTSLEGFSGEAGRGYTLTCNVARVSPGARLDWTTPCGDSGG